MRPESQDLWPKANSKGNDCRHMLDSKASGRQAKGKGPGSARRVQNAHCGGGDASTCLLEGRTVSSAHLTNFNHRSLPLISEDWPVIAPFPALELSNMSHS